MEPHRELGKMLLDDDDGLTRWPRRRLYHPAAAALGGDGEALEFPGRARGAGQRRRWSGKAPRRAALLRGRGGHFRRRFWHAGSLLARRRRR